VPGALLSRGCGVRWSAAIGIGAAMVACNGNDKDEGAQDTAPEPCPEETTAVAPSISTVNVACDGEGNLRYQVEADGVPSSAFVFTQATSQPDESESQQADNHSLARVDQDRCGEWSVLERILQEGAAEPVMDSGTVFTCAQAQAGELTHAFAVLDETGLVTSCVVMGHDPTGLVDGVYRRIAEPVFDLSSCVEGVPAP
jgi:hypothetical protein